MIEIVLSIKLLKNQKKFCSVISLYETDNMVYIRETFCIYEVIKNKDLLSVNNKIKESKKKDIDSKFRWGNFNLRNPTEYSSPNPRWEELDWWDREDSFFPKRTWRFSDWWKRMVLINQPALFDPFKESNGLWIFTGHGDKPLL